jgi:hypothetical protein
VNVSVELMTRDDGSGAFTHRFINDLDPTITDGEPVAAATWTITGGSELDATGRDGDSRPPEPSRQVSIYNGTGTITNGQSAPAHNEASLCQVDVFRARWFEPTRVRRVACRFGVGSGE